MSEDPGTDPPRSDAGDVADALAGPLVRGFQAAARARRLEKYGTEDAAEAESLARAEWGRPRRILNACVPPLLVGGVLAAVGAGISGSPWGGVAGFLLGAVPLAWILIARTLREHAEEARVSARVGEMADRRRDQMAWLEKRRKGRR